MFSSYCITFILFFFISITLVTSSLCDLVLLTHMMRLKIEDIINSTKLSLVASEIQDIMNSTLVHTSEFVKSSYLLQASVISMLFVVAYWSIIYLDSERPGINPPSPLSVFAKERWVEKIFLWLFLFKISHFLIYT